MLFTKDLSITGKIAAILVLVAIMALSQANCVMYISHQDIYLLKITLCTAQLYQNSHENKEKATLYSNKIVLRLKSHVGNSLLEH